MAEINADKVKIGELFNDPLQFSIPNFQRPPSWEKDNFDKLFEDIYDAFYAKQEEYFLGSIILKGEDNRYEIIDGQQRLTALAILLAVVRDETPDTSLKEEIQSSLYTKEVKIKRTPSVPRIKMWEDLSQLEDFIYVPGK
ncbi:MAG: DUF262 domain-containing protein, partial [Nitrososphaeria archaeon]|nr:DUF262 domain-containing protein [Nitrososphaeria archaeon]